MEDTVSLRRRCSGATRVNHLHRECRPLGTSNEISAIVGSGMVPTLFRDVSTGAHRVDALRTPPIRRELLVVLVVFALGCSNGVEPAGSCSSDGDCAGSDAFCLYGACAVPCDGDDQVCGCENPPIQDEGTPSDGSVGSDMPSPPTCEFTCAGRLCAPRCVSDDDCSGDWACAGLYDSFLGTYRTACIPPVSSVP